MRNEQLDNSFQKNAGSQRPEKSHETSKNRGGIIAGFLLFGNHEDPGAHLFNQLNMRVDVKPCEAQGYSGRPKSQNLSNEGSHVAKKSPFFLGLSACLVGAQFAFSLRAASRFARFAGCAW